MGLVTHHKVYFWDRSRFHRVMYITLTSGLCGSITTFSTWNMECNKIFYSQLDTSWGNSMGAYNGARVFEWLICMWVGIALPLSALHLGQHVALLSPRCNAKLSSKEVSPEGKDTKVKKQYAIGEIGLVLAYLITTVLVIVLPVTFSWVHLTYTATFGAVGAYSRYLLSKLNTKFPEFPIGTFIANVIGTWLVALWTLLAKFKVDYHRHDRMAVLYGLATGFCGCLTTISTFVNELDTMKLKSLYKYGITTFFFAQVGCILIFDVYAYGAVPSDEVMPDSLDFCHTYKDLCTKLMDHISCNEENTVIFACDGDDMSTFNGKCLCRDLDASLRMAELIIDSQTKYNVTQSLVAVWPTEYDDYDRPTEVFDMCISFENACQHFLDRIDCPADQQKVVGCDRKGVLEYK
jgi:CrcB protein